MTAAALPTWGRGGLRAAEACARAATNVADTLTGTFADGRIAISRCGSMDGKGEIALDADGSLAGWVECWGLRMADGTVLRSLRVEMP